jgi:hypothetical protein
MLLELALHCSRQGLAEETSPPHCALHRLSPLNLPLHWLLGALLEALLLRLGLFLLGMPKALVLLLGHLPPGLLPRPLFLVHAVVLLCSLSHLTR